MRKGSSHHYHIAPDGNSNRNFVLSDGQETLGALFINRVHAGSAVIKVDEAELDISRTAILRKSLALRRQSDSEAICFSANFLSGGKLATHGEEYCWTPINIRWSAWAWKDKRNEILMEVRLRHSFSGERGYILSAEPLTKPWQKELALLGWYLLSLNRANFGMHALSALKTYAGQI